MPPKKKQDASVKVPQSTNINKKKIEVIANEVDISKRKRSSAMKANYKCDSDSDVDEAPSRRKKMKKNDEMQEVLVESKQKHKSKAATPTPKTTKNKICTVFTDIDFSCSKKNASGEDWNFKISSWNVDGLRAWIKKGGLEYIDFEKPDVFCIQEIKCSMDKLPAEINLKDYKAYWACSDKEGYAGVGLYSKTTPLSVKYGIGQKEHDKEGRIITAEYEKFYIISVYVPNAGRGLVTLPKRLQWNEVFRNFVNELDKKKPVIICGDINVAHKEIDLTNPKTNTKNAGFTKEERDGFTEFLRGGYVDSFRKLYPEKTNAYTFWTYMANCRAKNVGWRLDYFLLSECLMDCVCDNVIRSEVFGSDHCPITLFLKC